MEEIEEAYEEFFYKVVRILYEHGKLKDALYILEISQPETVNWKEYEDFSVVSLYIGDVSPTFKILQGNISITLSKVLHGKFSKTEIGVILKDYIDNIEESHKVSREWLFFPITYYKPNSYYPPNIF